MTTRVEIKEIIKAVSAKAMSAGLYDDNTHKSRGKATLTMECLLEGFVNLEYINDYRICCDDSNNTDEVVRLKQFALDVYFKFKKSSKWVKHEGLAQAKPLIPKYEPNSDLENPADSIPVDTVVELKPKRRNTTT